MISDQCHHMISLPQHFDTFPCVAACTFNARTCWRCMTCKKVTGLVYITAKAFEAPILIKGLSCITERQLHRLCEAFTCKGLRISAGARALSFSLSWLCSISPFHVSSHLLICPNQRVNDLDQNQGTNLSWNTVISSFKLCFS